MKALARRALAAPGSWPLHFVLAVLLLPRAVVLGEALFERDLHLDWYPRVLVFAATVRANLPPLWDLSIGFGQPLLGDPSAQVLYPTTWLSLLLAPWTVYTVYAVLHLVVSAVGMTLLARAAGLRQGAAAVAGAAWMLGGPLASLVNLWHHLGGAAWMPWVVLALHRAARRPGLRSVLSLGACLGLQVLAGSADMVLLTAGVGGVWLLVAGRRPRRGSAWRVAGAVVLGVGLAALVSAGQWLPVLELATRGVRRELPAGQAVVWSVPPAGLLRALVPLDATGRLAYAPAVQEALFDSSRPPFLGSLYVGVVALALAGAALVAPRRRPLALGLAATGVVAVLVAMGPHCAAYGLATRLVPGAAHLRYPSKVMVAFGFATALLAGLGLAAVRSSASARRVAGALAAAGALVLCVGAVLLGPGVRWAVGHGVLLDRSGVEGDALPSAARLLAGAMLAALAGAALRSRGPAGGRPVAAATGVVAACLGVDLLLAHHDLHATAPPSLLTLPPPVLSAVDRRDRARVYVYEYLIVEGTSRRLLGREAPYAIAQPPPGIDPRPAGALAQRVYPVPPVAGTWGVEGSYDLDLRGLQPVAQWSLNLALRGAEGMPAHRRLLRMGAVRTVVSLHRKGLEDLVPGPTFHGLFPEPILTWRVPGALPRAYVVGRARAAEGPAAVRALVQPDFDPESEAILSGEGAAAAAALAAGGTGSVRILEMRGDRVRLEAELDAPGVVVDVDAWDPGWRAWVDGRPAPLVRANGAFRGIPAPAGRHLIEMRYRPRAVLVGLGLSALGLAACVAGAGALLGRRLNPASSTSSAGSRRGSASGAGSPPA